MEFNVEKTSNIEWAQPEEEDKIPWGIEDSDITAKIERDPELQKWEHSRIIIHVSTFWEMKKVIGNKEFSDTWTLYCFYYATARRQATNQPWALDVFCMKGLGWSKTRFYKYKKLLLRYGFIEQVRLRDDKGKFLQGGKGTYVKVNYMSKDPVHSPKNKTLSIVPVLRRVVKSETNALSNKLEMLKVINSFDEFWSLYPRKVAKKKTLALWMKLRLNEDLFKKIMDGVKKYKKSEEWKKDGGKFIPYPTTFLNGERWKDELDIREEAECPF